MHLLSLLAVAAAVFAATNIDDIFILLVFFSDNRYSAAQVIAGQYLGFGMLVLVSFAASLIALVVPEAWVGLLGILPLALGVKKLFDPADDGEGTSTDKGASNTLTVAAVTVANGGDNIGIYTPLFASHRLWEVAVLAAAFFTLVAVWCIVARLMIGRHRAGVAIRRYGHKLLPFVLIGLGLWILSKSWWLFDPSTQP